VDTPNMQLLPLHRRAPTTHGGQGAKPVTNEADILGRKAARHPTPETVIDLSDVKRNAMKIRRSKA